MEPRSVKNPDTFVASVVATSRRSGWFLNAAAPAAFLLLVAITLSGTIQHGIQIGSDEHYEVTKALLLTKGHSLYHEIWNDQPPLLTVVQGEAFRCFGPSIGTARAVALCFSVILIAGLFRFVRRSSDALAGFAATVLLLAAPSVLELSVSAMLEVPAIGIALCALGPIQRWCESSKMRWLVCSALLLATALQFKLTAVITVPALITEIALLSYDANNSRKAAALFLNFFSWGATVLSGFLILGWIFGSGYRQAWASHFSEPTPESLAQVNQLRFSPTLLSQHTELLWASVAGIAIVLWKRSWRRLVFPLVMLATAVAVHLLHRPYWPYYNLHFAVPMAWLGGYGLTELCAAALARAKQPSRPSLNDPLILIGASVAVSSVVIFGTLHIASEIRRINDVPSFDQDPLLAAMKKYAPQTRWVYTPATMYPFHARLPVIPDLAVMPRKRYWSGEITQEQILTTLKRYRPEQLLLPYSDLLDRSLSQIVTTDYTLALEFNGYRLYISNALRQPPD